MLVSQRVADRFALMPAMGNRDFSGASPLNRAQERDEKKFKPVFRPHPALI